MICNMLGCDTEAYTRPRTARDGPKKLANYLSDVSERPAGQLAIIGLPDLPVGVSIDDCSNRDGLRLMRTVPRVEIQGPCKVVL